MSYQLRQSLLLLVCATIWGTGFVPQALGIGHIGPFAFTWARCLIGGLFLLVAVPWFDRINKTPKGTLTTFKNRELWRGGTVCGTLLFISESLQQFGLIETPVGKAGFLTGLYIIFVPLIGIFFRKKTGLNLWIAVIIAVVGLYLLCLTGENWALNQGDTLVILCAVGFSLHILAIDHFVDHCEAVRMSCIQFFFASLWGAIATSIYEPISLEGLKAALWCILYSGVLSNGFAYTLQAIGQKGVHPTLASLIMSLESVVSVLAGWLFLNQILTTRELIGCAVIAMAIVIAQLPQKK